MPYLEESEWEVIAPYLKDAMLEIKRYREKNKCDLLTARLNCQPEAMKKFKELTGKDGVHFDVIHHHRLADWGDECPKCNYLLRTVNAKLCVNCGWKKPSLTN